MTGDDDRPVLLFGTEHADILDVDEWQAAADWFADCRAAGDVFPQTLRVRIFAHSVLPPGDYGGERLPDGETLASRVVDDLDCLLFDELADQLEQAAKLPEVAAAFQAAIDLLASRVPFCVADDVVSSREWQATIAEPGYNWSDPVPVDDDARS